VGRLVVVEATVGRALVMRRLDVRGRSKSGRIEKPFSHLRIVVCEPEEV
ncbi:MAG: uL22 family ribosomal protein, partial [Holosporales bacterium]